MLITFSDTLTAPDWYSDPEATVKGIIARAGGGAWGDVTWARGREVRFTLRKGQWMQAAASNLAHEAVILALLILDPRATIRTSRALYCGLADYKRQNGHDPEGEGK